MLKNVLSRVLKLPYLWPLGLILLANLLVLSARNAIVGDHVFSFLKSNLFIGTLPVIFIAYLIWLLREKLNNLLFWILTILWVLFYPNAPYMISDLIHNSADPLDEGYPELVKYDTMLIFSISMTSVFYGFASLNIMYNVFWLRFNKRFANIAIITTLVLSCLGFYMGRELLSALKLGNGYLYSWEVFLEPMDIIKTTWNALFPIHKNWPAYAMMGLFGFVQLCLLIIMQQTGDIRKQISQNS